jgi:DNA-binding transcriptional ArsR family regulator
MPSAAQGTRPQAFGISARMARALADSLRVRILAELSVRALSPSRFVEEIGGELTQVSRYFRQLADWGYIELIEERPGRRHGAAIEHIYRGVQRAYFDTSTWECVPRSDRDKVSQATVSSFFARITEAVKASTFDEEVDRHFSWDGVTLDFIAWKQLGDRLDEILMSLTELDEESANRLGSKKNENIPAIIGLAAFRSARSASTMLQASRRHERASEAPIAPSGIDLTMAKALSNSWRCRILTELAARPMSPSLFVEEIGGSLGHVSRCFRELASLGFIEIFEEKKGGRNGGGIERIYRSIRTPYFDDAAWSALPRLVREEMSQSFLSSYFERVTEAIDAGTFDADIDRHFSWKPVYFDRTAWEQLGASLDEVLAWLLELEAESLARVGSDVEQLIPTIVGLTSFRSPIGGSH